MSGTAPRPGPLRYDWSAARNGARALACLAGVVMFSSFTGFGALLNSLQLDLSHGIATNVLIFALPGQVVLVDLWRQGASVFFIALAVSLTAVRLLPMVILVLSRARVPTLPLWPQFVVAQFTAITTWVIAQDNINSLKPEARLPWLLGLCAAQVALICFATVFGYLIAQAMPPLIAAPLVFLTPCYFLIALCQGAHWRFDHLSILFGAGLGAVALYLAPGFDLLIAGVVGGTLAYFLAHPAGKGRVRR